MLSAVRSVGRPLQRPNQLAARFANQRRYHCTSLPKRDLPEPKNWAEYSEKQKLLPDRSLPPSGDESFRMLRKNKSLAYRDVTAFFQQMRALEPYEGASLALIRGRRWGKTVLGDAWLAFLSLNLAEKPEEKFLFEGTSVEQKIRKAPLVPLKLDVSQCQSVELLVEQFAEEIKRAIPGIVLPLPSPLFPEDPIKAPLTDFTRLCWTLRSQKSRFALFIDEYDFLVISALHSEDLASYARLNEFFAKFFTILKSHVANAIPFQLITGSSRLAMKGFWSGPNSILDLSTLAGSAEALGYTWESLYACYATQISWLATLHKLSAEDLRKKMEAWYNHHRWSPENPVQVFNPWSVDCFIRKGRFEHYWANTSSGSKIFSSHLLVERLLRALLRGPCSIDQQSLTQSRLPVVDQGKRGTQQISAEGQLSLLVGAGMLSISDTFDPASVLNEDNPKIPLKIPNLDAEEAIRQLLKTAVPVQEPYLASGGYFIKNRDFIGLINFMISTHAFDEALRNFRANAQLNEFHISSAFAFLVILLGPIRGVSYANEVSIPKLEPPLPGVPPRADHVFIMETEQETHILEFKLHNVAQKTVIPDKTKKKAGRPRVVSQEKLYECLLSALDQSTKYLSLVKAPSQALLSSYVFDAEGILIQATSPLTRTEVKSLVAQQNIPSSRVSSDADAVSRFQGVNKLEQESRPWIWVKEH